MCTVLLEAQAKKLSPKAAGHITFQLVKGHDQLICLRLLANTSGGVFCKRAIPIQIIIDTLQKQPASKPFKSSIIKGVFMGKGAGSSNNPGFLISALRSPEIGLVVPDSNSQFLSNLSKDFDAQAAKLLSL